MRWVKWSGLFLLLALPAVALAQGSGTIEHPPGTGGDIFPSQPRNAFIVTRSVEGKITKIDAQNQFIVIDDKKGNRREFILDQKLKLTAAKKTEFAGEKNIRLTDFEPGQFVKITYVASNSIATELRMIPPPR